MTGRPVKGVRLLCQRSIRYTNLASSGIDARQVDLGHKLYGRWHVRIFVSAVYVQAVDAVLVCALVSMVQQPILRTFPFGSELTCGGPSMVPFQFDINKSSPSDRPYEQASADAPFSWPRYSGHERGFVPAPSPFSPFSSSSNNRKFLGTFAPMLWTAQLCTLSVEADFTVQKRYAGSARTQELSMELEFWR